MENKKAIPLTLFFVIVAVVAIVLAKEWPAEVARFPIVVGIFVLILSLADLILGFTLPAKKDERASSADLQSTLTLPTAVSRRRTMEIFAWITACFLLIALIGFHFSIPLFIFLFLMFVGRYGWCRCMIYTAVAWGFFYGLFELLLNIPFPNGVLIDWFDIGL